MSFDSPLEPLPHAEPVVPDTVFLALGGNLGDVRAAFAGALRALEEQTDEPVACSRLYRSEPWGERAQPEFLNLVARVNWPGGVRRLLERCRELERAAGRERASESRWGPRPLDIDILLAGGMMIDEPDLTVPHPRIAERRFVLVPLLDLVARTRVLPGRMVTLHELLARCPDTGRVEPVSDGPWEAWRIDIAGDKPARDRS